MRSAWAALAACALVAVPLAAGQQAFRGGTDLVRLNVTVQDSQGRLISNLGVDDFRIFENGTLQTIENFSPDPQPIALSLLIDTSASMDRRLRIAQEAAIGFVRRLTPVDLAQVIDFDSQPHVRQDLTGDLVALEASIRATRAGGPTALYNALYVALNQLQLARIGKRDEVRRQAIVVLSDGEDTASLIDYVEVLDLSKRSEVAVYAVGLRAEASNGRRNFDEAESVLRAMTTETGGRAFFVQDVMQLEAIYSQIADELASQYTIGYVSTDAARDGAWRAISVRLTSDHLAARTRTGYYAPKSPR